MDPRLLDVITIQNIDEESFEIIYDNKSYGIIEPGKVWRGPRFLAEHALKHLIDQCLNRANIPVNNSVKRRELAAKMVINEQQYVNQKSLSEAEKLQQEVESLNKGSDLENTLNDRRGDALPEVEGNLPELDLSEDAPPSSDLPSPVAEPAGEEAVPLPVGSGVQEPAPAEPIQPEAPTVPVETTDSPVTGPTRQQLYDWAKTQLNMDLNDPKTIQAFENMSIPELITELQYER